MDWANWAKSTFSTSDSIDLQLAVAAQALRQVTVELDHRQAPEALHQRLGQCRQAGADFNHGLTGLRVDGIDNGLDDAAIGQKMLAETLARNVLAVFQGGDLQSGGSRSST